MSHRALDVAFRATSYVVETDAGKFGLRIGEANAAFDAWLSRHGTTCWAILTAYNPGGVRTDGENVLRQTELLRRINSFGYAYFPSCNMADDGTWPAEHGVLILQVEEAAAQALASEFSQVALVVGNIYEVPRLVWTGVDV